MRHCDTTDNGVHICLSIKGVSGNDRNAGVEFFAQHFKLEARGWDLELHIHRQVICCGDAVHELRKGCVVGQLVVFQLPFESEDHVFRCHCFPITPLCSWVKLDLECGEVFGSVFHAGGQPWNVVIFEYTEIH